MAVADRAPLCEHVFVSAVPRVPTDEATILHADLDSFYASVEQRDDPTLRGRPVIVGGGGVVLAASYEAKAFGIRAAMGGRMARELCPRAVFVEPRFDAYTEASKAVFAVFDDVTPLVEPMSIDEAFLEVRGLQRLAGSPREIAVKLRADVRERVGLPITVGVARTKFLAKVASGVGKPDGLLVVDPDRELEFLHPLPVQKLWGVGPITTRKLNDRGIYTVADVASLPEPVLTSILGPYSGRHISALAENRDPRRVTTGKRRRSIGSQRALGHRMRTADELDAFLVGIVDRVTGRMRKAGRAGRTIVLRIRFDDYRAITRSHSLDQPTAHTETVLHVVRVLLDGVMAQIAEHGVTRLGISVANLDDDDTLQLTLPFDQLSDSVLDTTLDAVRVKFGNAAITRAVLVGKDEGLSMPMLPD
ncbi:MAG: dinB [Ilumatobacteraceae bacterium]|nr:dinB [Ilumatobacteraceae bacterium]